MSQYNYADERIKHNTDAIKKEINFYESLKLYHDPPFNEYLNYLHERTGNSGKYHYSKDNSLEEHLNQMKEQSYNMNWGKLKQLHKEIKVAEYVDNLEGLKNKKQFTSKLIKTMKENKLFKNNGEIEYDPETMTITKLNYVYYDKKMKKYLIKS